jgi:mono/diheme cytochrome c family protein
VRLARLSLYTAFSAGVLLLAGCGPPLPPGKPLSQLTPEELRGHAVYGQYCARCHYADSQGGLRGPGLEGVFREKYLPSGAPANDARVTAVIEQGRSMMPAFGNDLDQQQLQQLLAYLHTL